MTRCSCRTCIACTVRRACSRPRAGQTELAAQLLEMLRDDIAVPVVRCAGNDPVTVAMRLRAVEQQVRELRGQAAAARHDYAVWRARAGG
jgi:hypothetical protein